MLGKKKERELSDNPFEKANESTYEPIGVAAGAQRVEGNVFELPRAVYYGKRRRIDTKAAANEEQVRAFWRECREDGTLEALRALAHEKAQGYIGACTNFGTRAYDYWVAVEAAPDAALPGGYETLEADARLVAAFPLEGPAHEAMAAGWTAIYNKWFPKAKYQYAAGPEVENYPFGDMQSADYRCEVLVPVKPLAPVRFTPRRRGSMLSLLFIALGAAAGMLVAGSSGNATIYMLVGAAVGYFAYSYVNKLLEERAAKKGEGDGGDGGDGEE